MAEYDWNVSKSKGNIIKIVKSVEGENKNEETIVKSASVTEYKKNLTKMFNEGETYQNMLSYKNSVLNLLKLKSQQKSADWVFFFTI